MTGGEVDATEECPSPTAALRLEAERDDEAIAFVRGLLSERNSLRQENVRLRMKIEAQDREISNLSLKSRGQSR